MCMYSNQMEYIQTIELNTYIFVFLLILSSICVCSCFTTMLERYAKLQLRYTTHMNTMVALLNDTRRAVEELQRMSQENNYMNIALGNVQSMVIDSQFKLQAVELRTYLVKVCPLVGIRLTHMNLTVDGTLLVQFRIFSDNNYDINNFINDVVYQHHMSGTTDVWKNCPKLRFIISVYSPDNTRLPFSSSMHIKYVYNSL